MKRKVVLNPIALGDGILVRGELGGWKGNGEGEEGGEGDYEGG
jgi:hypothetical protein